MGEVELELFQYVNLSSFVGAKTGKRCSNIYFRILFSIRSKTKMYWPLGISTPLMSSMLIMTFHGERVLIVE